MRAQVVFQETLGNGTFDQKTAHQTFDGGYIVMGGQYNGGTYLSKLNATGNLQWSKTYSGCYGIYVIQSHDSGYVIAGQLYSSGSASVMIKTDKTGNIQWTNTLSCGPYDYLECVKETIDRCFIFSGYASLSTNTDVFLIKADSLGNILWSKTVGTSTNEDGISLAALPNGEIFISGVTNGFSSGDFYLAKTDASGNVLWSRSYGGTGLEEVYAMDATKEGGAIMTGFTESFGSGLRDVYVVKTDSAGNMDWSKTYGGANFDHGLGIKECFYGGFVIGAMTKSFGFGNNDAYLIRTDANGNVLWSNVYGGSGMEQIWSIDETSDHGFILAGNTDSFISSPQAYVIRTNNLGLTGCNEMMNVPTLVTQPPTVVTNLFSTSTPAGNIISNPIVAGAGPGQSILCASALGISSLQNNISALNIFPDPANDNFSISFVLENPSPVIISFYDAEGKMVREENEGTFVPGDQSVMMNGADLPCGLYFILVEAGNTQFSQRILIEH